MSAKKMKPQGETRHGASPGDAPSDAPRHDGSGCRAHEASCLLFQGRRHAVCCCVGGKASSLRRTGGEQGWRRPVGGREAAWMREHRPSEDHLIRVWQGKRWSAVCNCLWLWWTRALI